MPDPNKTEEGLPILKKANADNSSTEEGLPILKKKLEESPSNLTSTSSAPSVSVGGTSGLENGASEPTKSPIDFEGARTYKVPAKTALGNKVISYTKPSATIGLDEERSNKKLADDFQTKQLVDHFDSHKATHGPDKKLNTADFYLENLKKTNPEEYQYTIDKQEALSKEGDPLKTQEYHADLIKKALSLKTKVMGGKLDLVTNNINDNYKPILDDFDKTSKEAEGLSTQISGIDDFINKNFQKDQNGQLITNATNRKVAEDMIKQREALIGQFETNKTKLDEYSNNQDLKDALDQLDDIQKTYDASAALYKDFAEKNPNAYKGLPEVKKQIEKEQQAQFSKDIREPLEGDLGIMEGSGRGATGIVKSLAYGVKNLGEDKGYGFTDEFYDNVKGSLDKFDKESNALPTGYDKPVYEDGKWNLNYLPGKLSQTIVEMAPMAIATGGIGATAGLIARGAAAKELGYTLGSFVGEHVAVVSNYYDEAREAGMSEDEAQDFANKTATAQAAISMISPDLKLLKSNRLGLDDYTKMVAQGVSKKEAAKQTAKNIVNNMMKEVPQENLQTWKEIQDQNAMYESMGLNDKVKKSITNDIVETTIVSTLLTAGFGISGAKSASSMQKQAAFMAASQPDLVVARAQKMLEKGTITQEQFDDVTLKMAKASEALQKIDKTLPAETKAEVLPAMIEKNDLKAEKTLVDDSQHDAINEKIKIKDEEIKNIMESPSKEQIEHDDFLKGFDTELSKASEEKPAKVEIPKSENQQQLEGLIEKDDSQKSVPIELNPQVETSQEPTEQEKVDNQIALLEKAIDDMKKNEYWQEKITAQQFGERSRAIEKEINKLKKPVAIEEEKIAEKPTVVEAPAVEEKTPETTEKPVEKKSSIVDNDWHENFKKENPNTLLAIDEKNGFVSIVDEKGNSKEISPEDFLKEVKQSIADGYKGIAKVSRKTLDSQVKQNKTTKAPIKEKVAAPKPTTEATTEKPVEKKKEPDNSSLIDEEEETVVKDDSDTVKKMLDDLEILKQYSPNNVKMDGKTGDEIKSLATKKYQGMIERAYKAKLDGKINQSTYELFRDDANNVLGPKIAEKNREVKGQIDAIKEKIKEKILGEGKYKNGSLMLMSAPGINPKTVADLIDLTADLVKRGVDAGHEVRKAVDVALNYIKGHKNYEDILKSEKIPESKFRKMFEAKIGALESIVKQSEEKETPSEKPTEEKTTQTQSNKETEATATTEEKPVTEKSTESNEKPVIDEIDISTGDTKKMKHFQRIESNDKYKSVVETLKNDNGDYSEKSIAKVEKYATDLVSQYEKNNELVAFANYLKSDESQARIDPLVIDPVRIKAIERLNELSQSESINETERNAIENLSADLYSLVKENQNADATKTKITGEIAKKAFDVVSSNPKITERVVENKVRKIQKETLSDKQKSTISDLSSEINEELVKESDKSEKKKKIVVNKSDLRKLIDSLKTDLSGC